jgi:hypothetical protein
MLQLGTATEWREWWPRGWPLWASLVLAFIGVVSWQAGAHTEATVRRIGLGYEVIGVVAVLVELILAMKRHDIRLPHSRLVAYLLSVPFLKRRRAIALHARAGGFNTSGGSARFSSRLGPNATIEQRVTQLETLAEEQDRAHYRLVKHLEAETVARAAADAQEAHLREQGNRELHGAVKSLEVGGLKLSLFGLLWLLFGMVLTTGTQEVCALLLRCST